MQGRRPHGKKNAQNLQSDKNRTMIQMHHDAPIVTPQVMKKPIVMLKPTWKIGYLVDTHRNSTKTH